MAKKHLFLFLLLVPALAFALSDESVEAAFTQGIVVDLREPEFCNGVLTTDKGGIITGPDMRVQARKIIYTRKVIEGKPVLTIDAEGDLLLEFSDYVFVGSRLVYDFQEHTGVVYDGRTAEEPWFFGGKAIYLRADGSYDIEEGFITTSENVINDWEITADAATITDNQYLTARHVKFRFFKIPLFFLPTFKANLSSIFDSTIRYKINLGGKQGTRASLSYEVFSWNRFTTFLRLDYRFKRGLGGGIETHYLSEDHREELETINFVAHDSAPNREHEKIRYRFQGVYNNLLLDDSVEMNMTWDKISDEDMPTDYKDNGLELDTSGRTQLLLRHECPYSVTNFYSRVRVNPFQTVKQELPSLQTQLIPFILGTTGIINDTQSKISYLDFKYSNGLPHVHDYHSVRLEYSQKLYRPFYLGPVTATPQAGIMAIYYGGSPEHEPRWMTIGLFGMEFNSRLHRYYGPFKHVLVPYLDYSYYTYPSTSPNDHYIFDIQDGWYRLDMMKCGLQQNFYVKNENGCISRYLLADVWFNAFFHTKTIHSIVPVVYGKFVFNTLPILRHTVDTAWDLQRTMLYHFNIRTEWTISPDMALAAEYRHRDAYDWRKVDHNNFILDSFRPVHELRDSALSDRRDTLLLHFFYQLHPNWAIDFSSRQGWNRMHERRYNEYEIEVLTTLGSAWHLAFSYRHREEHRDPRFAFNIWVGLNPPDRKACENITPNLEF